jgi:ankyrin repeat/SOCS box protein 13/metal transporter CNNM
MALLFVVAWPLSKLLDCVLGHDHGTFFRRAQLKVLVDLHGANSQGSLSHHQQDEDDEPLTVDEVLIIKVVFYRAVLILSLTYILS